MSVTIRHACASDADALAQVSTESWRDAYPVLLPADYLANQLSLPHQRARWRRRLRKPCDETLLIAANPGTDVIGYVTFGRCRRSNMRGYGEIYELYVATDYQDQGVGRRLVEAAIERLRGEARQSVLVEVLTGNPSRFFYERLGAIVRGNATRNFAGRNLDTTLYLWGDTSILEQDRFRSNRPET
ncbi:MAG: GNAT family N-acetyltransferase [Alphaproteobacteria bacterium]|nr:GNAT family N-acetyltransferase [Alphaproteobacteria bacterium]